MKPVFLKDDDGSYIRDKTEFNDDSQDDKLQGKKSLI